MALTRLVYASRANSPFSIEQLNVLARSSAERNAFRDITGALLYCDGHFLQMLEGAEWCVRHVFEKIARDARHRDVRELSCRPILDRAFGAWGMSCLHEDASDEIDQGKLHSIIEKANSEIKFDALGEAAHRLMNDLKGAIERQSTLAGVRQAA